MELIQRDFAGRKLDFSLLRKHYYSGAIFPDIGNYPEGIPRISNLSHNLRTWDLVSCMLKLSKTPYERIFAYGWASHVAADVIGHPKFTNLTHAEIMEVKSVYPEGIEALKQPLEHKKTEFGASAYLLGLEQNSFLWDIRFEFPLDPGSEKTSIIEETFIRIYGYRPERKQLLKAMKSLQKVIIKIPIVMKFLGRIKGRWYDILENPVALFLKISALPLYLSLIDKQKNQGTVAVLCPFKLKKDQIERLNSVIDEIVKALRIYFKEDFMNMKNINLDSGKIPRAKISPHGDDLMSLIKDSQPEKTWHEEFAEDAEGLSEDWKRFNEEFFREGKAK